MDTEKECQKPALQQKTTDDDQTRTGGVLGAVPSAAV